MSSTILSNPTLTKPNHGLLLLNYVAAQPEAEPIACTDFLGMLQQLESDYGLPSGTAERFKAVYDDAAAVSDTEQTRYAAAWDAYHEALDADDEMATLARVYGQHTRLPLFERINAEGTFNF